MLPAEVVYDLAKILQLNDRAFIVGGQALNVWAERYWQVEQEFDQADRLQRTRWPVVWICQSTRRGLMQSKLTRLRRLNTLG
jgi:hypothetical protein